MTHYRITLRLYWTEDLTRFKDEWFWQKAETPKDACDKVFDRACELHGEKLRATKTLTIEQVS